jgi:hypothetical protein
VAEAVKGDAAMPTAVPPEFRCIPYDAARHPRSAAFAFGKGANCQLWAYALLKHIGLQVPPLRSSELWDDTEYSDFVERLEPLDLMLFNATASAWGAHVAVYLGDDAVAHLSRHIGLPEVCAIGQLLRTPKYRVLVGVKRIKVPNPSTQPWVWSGEVLGQKEHRHAAPTERPSARHEGSAGSGA